MLYVIILAVVISFITTYIFTPKFITYLRHIGVVGVDVHKKERPELPEMGGPMILAGFLAGIFFFIWINVFLYKNSVDLVKIFAGISTVMLISLVGIFDDLGTLSKKTKKKFNFKRIGLKQWQKPLLTLCASVPLMAIMAGDSTMVLPFLGSTDFGIIYPLVLVPVAVVGASNATNMLAGMNGLEAGLGVILLCSLGIFAYNIGEIVSAVIALTITASLLAFLKFNWYPAKVMPGDSLPYTIGAAVALVAILGNMEKFAVLCFIPWFIEFILKLRTKFKAESFGVLQNDGTLKSPYTKIYSLTHLVMRFGKFKENQIVSIIIAFEILVVTLAF
jgi:UDP-N-acetylglucosamine--dolichyl-phosphate N-acetylglucosaminephosphotransferase